MARLIEERESEPIPLRIAHLFPGQAFDPKNFVLTAKNLLSSEKARYFFRRTDGILGNVFPGNRTFSDLILNGSTEEQNQLVETENAQPAVLTLSLASVAAFEEFGGDYAKRVPGGVAGHSAGMIGALWDAEVIDSWSAIFLSRKRGEAMRDARKGREPGAMAAVINREPINSQVLQEICQEFGVELANINSPMQIVVSGTKEGVSQAREKIEEIGLRVIPLVTSDAFHHSKLMEPAVDLFCKAIEAQRITFGPPRIPVYLNSTGQFLWRTWKITPLLLASEITKPVNWVRVIDNMKSSGVNAFMEFGHGNVLTGLIQRMDPSAKLANIGSIESAKQPPFK